ncbi:MAG: hypothetical protein KJ941_11820 [Bacteroidetes bacterium]|nr:hypothetical protein [Bacteroidota bacterium]
MDYDIERRFQNLTKHLEKDFGGGMDVQAILFLVGVDALGAGYKEFSKQEKTDLLHVAICTILEPSGYYSFEKRDEQGWPHFKLVKPLPELADREQQHLIKEALIEYFVSNGLFEEETFSN